MKATEPAFSGKYVHNHAIGTYACVCCGAPLFSSRAKFDSGTGWPSFWSPYAPERIQTAPDYHGSEPRIEVMCSRATPTSATSSTTARRRPVSASASTRSP